MKKIDIIVNHPEVLVMIKDEEKMLAQRILASDRTLSVTLINSIDEMLKEGQLKPVDIKEIIVQEKKPSFSTTRTVLITGNMLVEAWGSKSIKLSK